MAAFRPYSGGFIQQGEEFLWSCYATAKVFELRAFDDAVPAAGPGRKWVPEPANSARTPAFMAMVACDAGEFSQILCQVTRAAEARALAG